MGSRRRRRAPRLRLRRVGLEKLGHRLRQRLRALVSGSGAEGAARLDADRGDALRADAADRARLAPVSAAAQAAPLAHHAVDVAPAVPLALRGAVAPEVRALGGARALWQHYILLVLVLVLLLLLRRRGGGPPLLVVVGRARDRRRLVHVVGRAVALVGKLHVVHLRQLRRGGGVLEQTGGGAVVVVE